MIKATVIATVYNQAEYVAQMIESVVTQITDFEFEFIIANDCSTDKSGEIINQYAKKYKCIRFIDNFENLGITNNYMQCLQLAEGEYVAGLGGDDFYIDKNKLQMQVDFLEAHPDYGLVHTQFDELYMQKKSIKPRYMRNCQKEGKDLQGDVFYRLAVNNKICAITVCFRRSLVPNAIIETILKERFAIEDLPMWLQISRTHKVGYINKSTVCYRRHDNSACHFKDIDESLEYNAQVLRISRYFLERQGLDSEAVDSYCKQHQYLTFTYYYFKKNNIKMFKKYYSKIKDKPLDRIIMLWVLRLRLGFLFS